MADDYASIAPQIFCNIARQLEQNADAIRIKKLILYTCKNWWESDLKRLSVVDLAKLVQELRQLNPTLDQLRAALKTLVETLNKKEEYVLVADLIIENMQELYAIVPPAEEVTAILTPVQNAHPNPLLTEIAQKLEQDSNLIRIKKLMLSAARKSWQKDALAIHHADLKALICELWQSYPTSESLGTGLAAVVNTLNKPVEYALIAEAILREMNPLYLDRRPFGEPRGASHGFPVSQTAFTEQLPVKVSSEVIVSDLPQLSRPSVMVAPPEAALPLSRTQGAIDLFDVRLEIMKYANPLRAKILLFSVIYYDFAFRSQDWSNLKLYSLDGLLRSSTVVYQSLEELRIKLHETAQRLNQPDEFSDIATVIFKGLKPVYTSLQQQVQQAMQTGSAADTTRSTTRMGEQTTQIEITTH